MKAAVYLLALGLVMAPALSFSDESTKVSGEEKVSTDTSTNPITGTKTVTKKSKKSVKGPHGAISEKKRTEETKTSDDGVEKTIKTEDNQKSSDNQ